MFLQRLRVRNFRNFEDELIELPPAGAAFIGANGHGKTNLLEAIYYLEIFRSFRGARDDELVAFGADAFRVEGRIARADGDEEVEVAAGYVRDGRRKRVTINGNEPARMGEAIGRVCAIIFTASDVEIVAGSPGARRRFLDIILSLVEPGYLAALQRYRQILSQRNELLRDGASALQLAAWDDGLVVAGSQLLEARARWVGARSEGFARYYRAISGEQRATMAYDPAVPISGEGADQPSPAREEWEDAFREELGRRAERERRRGVTTVGPHRDDLRFTVLDAGEPLELRTFGSAGQQRTAAIALRMVEGETLEARRGRRPIVMLDDVFAELDPERGERIMSTLATHEGGQILVTSPKPSEPALMGEGLARYRIEAGTVRPL